MPDPTTPRAVMGEALSEMRLAILQSPQLLHKWRVLRVREMRPLLTNYLSPDDVEQLCDFHIDNATASCHLRRHLIGSQNDHQLYDSILTYCEDKYEALRELVQFMWIDMDEKEKEQKNHQQDQMLELTENQLNILMDRTGLVAKFQGALDMTSIQSLLEHHLSTEDTKQLLQLNRETAAAFLHRKLLTTNRKVFFQELVTMCKTQRDDFQDCVDFMKNGNGNDLGANYDHVDNALIPQHTDELTLIKSQLSELRSALLGAVNDVMHQMQQCVNTNRVNGAETMDWMNLSIPNLQSIMDQCNARIIQMEDQLPQIHRTLQDYESRQLHDCQRMQEMKRDNAARIESLQKKVQEHQARMNKLERVLGARIDELKVENQHIVQLLETRASHLEAKTVSTNPPPTGAPAIPFNLPPSEKMLRTMSHFKWLGLFPILSDQFGKYDTIDWNNLGGDVNWKDQWTKMKRKEASWLILPPLVVPREYGIECVIVLSLDWIDNQLIVQGWIPSDAANWIPIPNYISVDAQISISLNGRIFKRVRRIFKISQSHWWTLFVIANKINDHWDLPTVSVQVFPLS